MNVEKTDLYKATSEIKKDIHELHMQIIRSEGRMYLLICLATIVLIWALAIK